MLFYTAAVGLQGLDSRLLLAGMTTKGRAGMTTQERPYATHPNAFFSVPCGAW